MTTIARNTRASETKSHSQIRHGASNFQ